MSIEHCDSTQVEDTAHMPAILPSFVQHVFENSTCIYEKHQVEAALDHMAQQMNDLLAETNPVFLCVVIGGIVCLGNLLPRLDFPLEVDYVHATRYGAEIIGQDIDWKVKPKASLKNRVVVIVDDILDGGITLNDIVASCKNAGAAKIYTAVLVDKKNARLANGLQHADFTGLEVGNHYVFGYGMDYKGYLRNAPGIYKVAPEHE